VKQQLEEPGDRAPAPGPLRLVQLFVNTNDLETGPDLLPDAAALGEWLRAGGLLEPGVEITDDDHARAIELREAIRELVSAHAGLPHDAAAAETVNAAALRADLRPVLADPARARSEPAAGAATRFEPSAAGVDGALGRIVAAIHEGVAAGTWERLKACERDVCRWAFYDHSKNRSGHWCSMAVCGQREKNRRAYRRRTARAR
jgi:predicted RNA-binding Zn ribbon-like protein